MRVYAGFVAVLTFVLVIICAPHSNARSSKDFAWTEITDADWEIQPDSSRGISDAVMIFEWVREDQKDLPDDKCYRTIYRRIRVLDEAGRKWADADFPHLSKKLKMELIKGRTVLRDGTVIELRPDQIYVKEIVRTSGAKIKQTSFSIPGVTEDCIVEYVVRYRIPMQTPTWIVQKDIPVLKGEFMWILPKWDLGRGTASEYEDYITPNYLWMNTDSRPIVTELPNIKKPESLYFKIDYVPAFNVEPFTVPQASLKTKLIVYHGPRKAAMSFWGDKSVNLVKGLDRFCKKDKKLKKVVKSFGNLANEEEKIIAAFNWVQDSLLNLTYDDYLDQAGKKLKTKKRKTTDDVIKRGYGDRSDIDYVFCDMLREMNVKAKVAYARDRIDDLFVREAKYWQFDRSFVCVEYNDGSIQFFAPGHKFAPIDQVPWYLEGVTALVGGGDNYLTSVPFSAAAQNKTARSYSYVIDEDLGIEGDLVIKLTGHPARTLRILLQDEDSTDFDNIVLNSIKDDYSQAELTPVSIEHLEERDSSVVLKYSLEQPELLLVGDRILLKPFDLCAKTKNPFYDPDRERAVVFRHAERVMESVEFVIPPEWTIETLPHDTSFQNQVGSCSLSFQMFGDHLSAQQLFVINSPLIPLEFYPELRQLYQTRQYIAGTTVILRQPDSEN